MIPIFAVVMASDFAFNFYVMRPPSLAGDCAVLSAFEADRAEFAVFFDDARERRFGVVVEEAEPAIARGLREQAALGFERLDGVEVVAHDPGERHVRARRHEVGEAVERSARALQTPALHRARVAGHGFEPQARQDLVVRGHQLKLAAPGERSPVLREVAGAGALVRAFGVLVLGARDEVARVREGRDRSPVVFEFGVAARVVEVQVRVDDDRQVFGRAAGRRTQALAESWRALDAVHLGLARRPLVAESRLDEDALAPALDEETVGVEADAVQRVGRRNSLPERARHDAEHRAAVEAELCAGHDLNAVVAELHRRLCRERRRPSRSRAQSITLARSKQLGWPRPRRLLLLAGRGGFRLGTG